jgi:hypothetical protein
MNYWKIGSKILILNGPKKGGAYTIGRITGTTTNVGWSKDFVILKKITLTSGTLDSLGIAVASSVVSKVVLYSDNAGNPDQLLAQTASSTLVIGTNVLDVSNISITAGDYWIGAIGQTSISFNTNLNSLSAKYFSWPYATALPTTAPFYFEYCCQRNRYLANYLYCFVSLQLNICTSHNSRDIYCHTSK